VRIDGGTSVDERQSIVDNFNTRGIGQVSGFVSSPAFAELFAMMQCVLT
jgi:SNF2 family DNA or RNA helicase